MSRFLRLSIILLLLSNGITAQDDADSVSNTAFRKGRNLVGIGGSVSSSSMDRSQITNNPSEVGNNYSFNVILGRFVANKNIVGLAFDASRIHLVGYVESKAEMLNVGPWYRLYLGKHPNLSFYLQSRFQYSSYFGNSSGVHSLFTIDEEVRASGINGSIGLGISYVMVDRISFEVGCDYHQGRFWGTLSDKVLSTDKDIVLDRSKFVFSFGFVVLFGKIKENE